MEHFFNKKLKTKYLPLPKKQIFLPLIKNEKEIEYDYLLERLRRKKDKYLEGLERFLSIKEAMIYSGIKSRSTLMRYRDTDTEFAEKENDIIIDYKADMMETAVKNLYLAVKCGDGTMIRYFLDRCHPDFKPKGVIDNNINLPENLKEIKVVFKDYSNDYNAKQNIQAVIHG